MAGCDVLYYDPAHLDRDPAGPLTRPAMAGSRVERPATSGWTRSWSCGTSVFASAVS